MRNYKINKFTVLYMFCEIFTKKINKKRKKKFSILNGKNPRGGAIRMTNKKKETINLVTYQTYPNLDIVFTIEVVTAPPGVYRTKFKNFKLE